MRLIALMTAGMALLSAAGQCQTTAATGVYALVDVRVEIGDGRVIEKGTVVLRNGLIESVGSAVTGTIRRRNYQRERTYSLSGVH